MSLVEAERGQKMFYAKQKGWANLASSLLCVNRLPRVLRCTWYGMVWLYFEVLLFLGVYHALS
jgi:hypothetical protein